MNKLQTAVLIFQSQDQPGIIAKISEFIFLNHGNIITADQHSTDYCNGHFFIRIEFCFDPQKISLNQLHENFHKIAIFFNAEWKIVSNTRLSMGILVSKADHCLAELLYRWKSGELDVNIPFVIANHEHCKALVESYNIPFYYIPANASDHKETDMLKLVPKANFLVLARYMQILSDEFITSFKGDIINIHHSFLPGFKGASPYQQAYDRGVKIIGATAHFVTKDLDEGPIIEQQVEHVSHRDSVNDLILKGKNLEKLALARAVSLYVSYRIIRFQNKTIIF